VKLCCVLRKVGLPLRGTLQEATTTSELVSLTSSMHQQKLETREVSMNRNRVSPANESRHWLLPRLG